MAAQPEEVTPEQIRARMSDTRADLSARLDVLRQQANPRTLLTRQLAAARHRRRAAADARRPTASGLAASGPTASGRTASGSGSAGSGPERAEDSDAAGPVRGAAGTLYRQLRQRPVLAVAAVALVGVAVAVLVARQQRR